MRRTPTTALFLAGALVAAAAAAHVGPPFPILEDQKVGPYKAAVWTDPDIGTATFYVVLEVPEGERLPAGTRVRIAVQPVSLRLPEVTYEAESQPVSEGGRFYTPVQLDRGEMWNVRVLLDGARGGGVLIAQVEATPAGSIGPIGLVLYPLPFLAMGFLWWRAASKRRQWLRAHGGGGGRNAPAPS